jgi:ATP-dependent DNA helicase RecQ
MPASLEHYYQESGRAGRDGERARCELLFDHSDRRIQKFFLANRYPSADDVAAVWRALSRMQSEQKPTALELAKLAPTVAKTKVRVALKALQDAGFVEAQHNRYAIGRQPFEQDQAEQAAIAYKRRADVDSTKLEQLIAYAFSARCRWRNLLDYFDETPAWERCGICDNCRHSPQVPPPTPGIAPSQEQERLAKQPVSLALGQRVSVVRYGEGTVTEVGEGAVTVAFPDGERRRFVASFVRTSAD